MSSPDPTPLATGSIEIERPATDVYAVVSDPRAMSEVNAETTRIIYRRGTPGTVGSRFVGRNRNGVFRWQTTCTVTDAEAGRIFGFDVTCAGLGVARWVYEFESLGEGRCRVTETSYDRRPGWFKRPGGWATGVSDRETHNTANIKATLERLKGRVEAGTAG